MPPIEDVVQSARQDRREPPRPVAVPTIIVHGKEDEAGPCPARLRETPTRIGDWTVRPLAAVLQSKATADVIEVWLPPQRAEAK